MLKDFDNWNQTKQSLSLRKDTPLFKEREIWWCSVGMNVGYEIFGKGEKFFRPVLILDKHNKHTFFGLPLTSTLKENNRYYKPLSFRGKEGSVILSQGRTLSSKRLANRMGWITETAFNEIRNEFGKLYIKK